MPFDFDIAMDVLESLNDEERHAVFNALNVIMGAVPRGDAKLRDSYALFAKKVDAVTVDIDTPQLFDANGNAFSMSKPIARVTFTCPVNHLFGIKSGKDLPEATAARKSEVTQRRTERLLDSLSVTRKDRDIL
jgi:hypothetical protein